MRITPEAAPATAGDTLVAESPHTPTPRAVPDASPAGTSTATSAVSWPRSFASPRLSRADSVPSGMPSCLAASGSYPYRVRRGGGACGESGGYTAGMSQTAEQVLAAALALPDAELYELIDQLTDAAHPPPPEPRGEAYWQEILRRSAEMDAGRTVFTPWEEVRQRAADRRAERAGG